MKKEFIKRVLREGIVDTRKYRYIAVDYFEGVKIKRLPVSALDTVEAIDGWKVVKILESACQHFINYHCSFDCPNLAIDDYDEYWGGPAAEDMGYERVTCKNCDYDSGECEDCYLRGRDECPKQGAATTNKRR